MVDDNIIIITNNNNNNNGHHSHIFLNLGMSLTFVKLISLQAEYRKVMPKTTVRFVF